MIFGAIALGLALIIAGIIIHFSEKHRRKKEEQDPMDILADIYITRRREEESESTFSEAGDIKDECYDCDDDYDDDDYDEEDFEDLLIFDEEPDEE